MVFPFARQQTVPQQTPCPLHEITLSECERVVDQNGAYVIRMGEEECGAGAEPESRDVALFARYALKETRRVSTKRGQVPQKRPGPRGLIHAEPGDEPAKAERCDAVRAQERLARAIACRWNGPGVK